MASGTSRIGWAAHAAGESSSGQDVVSASQGLASRAGCPVCSRSMPLTKTGAIRIHGPLSNRCSGSGMSLCSQGSLSSVEFDHPMTAKHPLLLSIRRQSCCSHRNFARILAF